MNQQDDTLPPAEVQICKVKITTYYYSLHTHTHPFNGPFSGTTQVSRYQKDKTNLDFTEARDSERQWHQLGHMQVSTSLQTNNHASTPTLSFYRPDALPAARPTASKHWRQRPLHTSKLECGVVSCRSRGQPLRGGPDPFCRKHLSATGRLYRAEPYRRSRRLRLLRRLRWSAS